MVKVAVAIETKDRRLVGQQNYLGETLRNLTRSGALDSPHLESLTIVSGGEMPGFLDEELFANLPKDQAVDVFACPEEGRSRLLNAREAIRLAARHPVDWVIKLEDDLDFCADFIGSTVRWLADYGDAPVPMWVLGASMETVSNSRIYEGQTAFQSFPRVRRAIDEGSSCMGQPVLNFWGAQALTWRRQMAIQLAHWMGPDPVFNDGTKEHRGRGHDLMLSQWAMSINARSFMSPVPSFVQHIGEQSNLANKFFQFPFGGRDWSYGGKGNEQAALGR